MCNSLAAAAEDRLLIQRHIRQQGSLKMSSLKVLFCGLPCTGKTTAMRRLSNQIRCLDRNESPVPSTGFDKPQTVEIYQNSKTMKQSVVVTGAKWKYQDLEQQGQTLYSRILMLSSNNVSPPDVDSSSGEEKQSSFTSKDEDAFASSGRAEVQPLPSSKDEDVLASSGRAEVQSLPSSKDEDAFASSGRAEVQSLPSSKDEEVLASSSGPKQQSLLPSNDGDVSANRSYAEDKPVLTSPSPAIDETVITSLVKAQDWKAVREKLKAIEDMTILHMMDCGGHPECHEILPLLLEGRSLSLLFLNLTHGLDKTYKVVFRGREGPSYIEYESVFTAREVLQRILCSISSLQSGAHKEKPVALLVGSYRGDTNAEDVLTLNTSVQEAMKSFIDKDILFAVNDQKQDYIATLDNMTDDQGDIEELRRVILNIIESRFEPDPIPTAWLVLHLLLRTKYEKEPGWCTVDECVKVASACGIKKDELLRPDDGILCYIHKHYGTLLYYRKVAGLCQKVICDPNIILHPFTRAFLFSFACNRGYKQTASRIRATGEIPHDLMETICAAKSTDPIPTSEIVSLLSNRYIIYENVRSAKGTREYFMPCLLQPDASVVKEASDPTTLSSLTPAPLLLVPHSTGYVPLGLFPALVVKLSEPPWKLKEKEQEQEQDRFRNRIQFKVRAGNKPTITVEFRQHPSYLELRLPKQAFSEKDLSVLICCRRKLWEALVQVSSEYRHMEQVIWHFGFYCPCGLQPEGKPHSALCMQSVEDTPPDMECREYGQDYCLEKKHKIWFTVSSLKHTGGLCGHYV